MKNQITKRQKDLLGIIYQYILTTGYPPTFEEMREKLGVASNQSVVDFLEGLQQGGFIKRGKSAARGLVILSAGYKALNKPPLVAFLGVSSAGAPIEAVEIAGEWLTVSTDVAQLKDEVFLLKISGDSMVNAGIDNGDVVLVKSQKEFISGDVVLADVSGEATVKRFISDDQPPYAYLRPENPKYGNILFTDDMLLKGKVISVFKQGCWKSVK